MFSFPTRALARAAICAAAAGAGLFTAAAGGAWVVTGQAHAQAAPILIRGPSLVPVAQISAPPAPPVLAAPAAPSPRSLDCLAAAVYYEARGETWAGQAAVAQVVLNRARAPSFPKNVCAVVYQGVGGRACQFSFACDGATRRPREPAAWSRARDIAERALRGYVMAAVGKATCFHAARLGGDGGRVIRLGGHVFFGGGGRGWPADAYRTVSVERADPARQARASMTFALALPTPVPVTTRAAPPPALIAAAPAPHAASSTAAAAS
ncbi:MAG: cell wall hydrolase [Caulobacteraceae bacterium]